METKDRRMCYGYIIKLYKTINSHQESRVPKDTDFLVWMNFDGMKILPVYSFEDFGRSLDICEIQDIDMTCERQKLYLYSIEGYKDIFGINDDSKYIKLPLIVITMINFFDTDMEFKDLNDCIKNVIENCQKDNTNKSINVDFEVMGTLSSHDYIIVFRGDSYNDINSIIFDLRVSAAKRNFPISITYSILAINKRDKLYWSGDKEIYTSIRIALDAEIDPQIIVDNLEQDNSINDIIYNLGKYTTFGKFDMGIEGNICEDKSKFLDLYENPKIFSGVEKSIYMTNTRFLNRSYLTSSKKEEKTFQSNNAVLSSREENLYIDLKEKVRGMIDELRESSISEKLKQSILRLILRVFQSNISVYTNQDSNNFLELIKGLMTLIQKWGEGANYQETIAEIVTALNILLDNRISANMRDFEIPQSSLRFSGSCSKLLVAYSNIVNDLSSIIGIYKGKVNQPLKYLVFVTADIDSKISAKLFFPEDDDYRFLNIKIPVDVMYNIQYAIPWLVHETGHFLRTYEREERNRSYFKSVFSMFNYIAGKYISDNFMSGSRTLEHKKICNAKCCYNYNNCTKEQCKFERFNAYSQITERFWSMFIMESGCQHDSIYKIPDVIKGEYIYYMQIICQQIRDAYDEAVADVFMLKILNIQQGVQYLKVMVKYFQNNCIIIDNELPTNIIIRIMAVLMLISKTVGENIGKYEEFEIDIRDISNKNFSNEIDELCNVILNKVQFFIPAQILYIFLLECVEKRLDELFKEKNVDELQKKIFLSYSQIENSPKEFSHYRDFIENFQKLK